MYLDKKAKTHLFSLFLIFFTAGAHSATVDLTGVGSNGGGYGNSLSFTDGAVSFDVYAFGETGAETPVSSQYYSFETAEIYSWATGLGSCNRQEGMVGSGCSASEHEVDTINRDDLLVFVFDQVVDFNFLTVDPYNGPGSDANDRDIIYWAGTVASLPDLTSETFDTLAGLFGPETHQSASEGYAPYTHSLSGTGNIFLLSGNYHDLSCKAHNSNREECEAYKIADISFTATTVPVPAAFWLFGTAIIGLGSYRRSTRKR